VLVLAIDTATPATAVAVVRFADGAGDGEVVATAREVAPNRHGEVLAPLVGSCLAEVDRAALSLIAVGTGPGPFTGLRVGLVTAAAMGDALGVEVRGVCSLDVLAAAYAGRPVVVVTDARRREVYWARYDATGRRVAGPGVGLPADVAADTRDALVVGHGVLAHPAAFADAASDTAEPYPDPARLAALALDPAVAGRPEPLYLRRPDARPPGPRKLVTPA
jgi:tRNA threonylcarbamoyladenosine biosynthesis protein TsaB